jgi:hypothetical protein
MESFVLLYNFPLLALDVKNVVNKNFMWLSGQFLEMKPKKTPRNRQRRRIQTLSTRTAIGHWTGYLLISVTLVPTLNMKVNKQVYARDSSAQLSCPLQTGGGGVRREMFLDDWHINSDWLRQNRGS